MKTCAAAIAFASLACGGCSTTLTVAKVTRQNDASVDGFRYSLPIPFLKVCPGAGGSIEVTEEYLPDPDNQYAISARSKWAKHDLNVEIDKGLLKKIDWNPDSAEVAAKSVESAGALAKTAIEEDAKARKARADREQGQAKEREAGLEAARKSVEQARAEVDAADAALAVLEANGAARADILKARVDLAKAQKKYEAAVRELERLRQKAAAAMDSANALRATKATRPQAQGCVFFRVVDPPLTDEMKVEYTLVQAASQQRFDTSSKLEPPPPPSSLEGIDLYLDGSSVIRPSGPKGILVFRFKTSEAIAELPAKGARVELRRLPDGMDLAPKYPVTVTPNSSISATVELPTDTPDGQYKLKIPVRRRHDQGSPDDLELPMEIRRAD